MKTIEITNFGGRLTRYSDGSLNSGFAKFETSWGYDPFSRPGSLTWLYQPDEVGGTPVTDAILAGKVYSPSTNEQYVYAIGNNGKLYKVDPTNSSVGNTPLNDSSSLIASIGSVTGSFTYGADLELYRSQLHITSDATVTKVNLDGSGAVSVAGAASISGARFHPMVQFQGSLYVGDGRNIAQIDSTGVMVDPTKLSPPLPDGMFISDLDVTPDGVYMIITASYQYPTAIGAPITASRGQPYAVDAFKFFWNGVDEGVTALEALASFPATALSTFLDRQFVFNQDAFGTAIYEGSSKLLTLPKNLSPMPNATAPNGTFLTWVSQEGTGDVSSSNSTFTNTYTSLFYYGQLDAENPAGLWRMVRVAPTSNVAYRAPLNVMVNNFSQNRQLVAGWGKHYFSAWEVNTAGDTSNYHLYRFVLPPAANTSPTLGVYETQNQLFSKRMSVKQVRVYTEGTSTGNGFQIDLIGPNGSVLSNGTLNYTFVTGTDETRLQGSMERINFNPRTRTTYSVGLRITNTGTTNMVIPKIEVDIDEEGR